MKFLLQKKSIILSVVFFIFSICIFIFLYKVIFLKKENTLSLQEKWQTEAKQREDSKSLVDLVKSVKSERELLEKHFVQSSDVVPFLNIIENMAKEVSVKAEVVSVDVPKNSPILFVDVKASGSFDKLYKLILLLENSPYDLDLVLVDMKDSKTEDSSLGKNKNVSQWTADFKIKLLSFIN